MTKLFARPRHTTRSLLDAQDLDRILNAFDKAALLVDKHSHEIVSVNSRAMEITAYTRDELLSLDISHIINTDFDDIMAMRTPHGEAASPHLKVNTRSQQQIEVFVVADPLGDAAPWAMITFEAVSLRDNKRATSDLITELLNHKLLALLSTTHIDNTEMALQEVLEIGQDMLPESTLGVYIGKAGHPSARLIESHGELVHILPDEISPPDLNHLLEASIWQKGQRAIVTLLHQSARSSGLAYLASVPIKDARQSNSWIGFIVACGKARTPVHTLRILELLAFSTSDLIHKKLLVRNLRQTISKSNQRLNSLDTVQEYVKDGIITLNLQMEIESVNPAAELIFGYASQEVHNQPIENIIIGTDRLHPAIQSALQGISSPSLGTDYLHRRDGSAFPAEIEVNPILSQDEVIGALIFVRDFSENEQIRIKTQQLEQRALLGEVTAIFAHEVRNPINNISMGLQLLARKLDDGDPEKDRLLNMQEDCHRLTRLMDSVLTFSRTGNYSLESLDIAILLERIFKRWQPRLTKLDISYSIQASQDLPPILGDLRSLEQVFTNIISNAVNAMEDNGGTFAVKIAEFNTNGSKSMIQVDLSDSGPGIPSDIQEKIFDPFFTTNTNGTGLGLSISKQIITAHKGSIALTSFPGGTSFHVQLPTTNQLEDPIV
jgi:two-component system, NtrC family, sensor histidine kinase AtoS